MNPADSVKRAALNDAIDYLLADPEKNMPKAMEAVNKYAPAGIFPAQRQAFANAIGNETNWYQLLLKVAHLNPEMIGGLLKTFVVNANFLAWGKQERMRAKYGCNIPWAILLDPTSACNLHCLGCWAADYGHKLNLTFEDIDSIVCQGKELGVHVYIHTGGEPLVRKDDVIALCRKHPDCAFLCFTNAMLIDEKFCQDMIEVKNFIPAISAEGFEETTDARRGEGTYKRIRHGMDLLRSHGLPFGVSTCYTSQNASAVCTEEYFDWMIEQGALFCWIFTYMPVETDAPTDLVHEENAHDLCAKCEKSALDWYPVATPLWNGPGFSPERAKRTISAHFLGPKWSNEHVLLGTGSRHAPASHSTTSTAPPNENTPRKRPDTGQLPGGACFCIAYLARHMQRASRGLRPPSSRLS